MQGVLESDELLPPELCKLRIELPAIEQQESLGSGSFGEVRAARWKGARVASKQMHRSRLTPKSLRLFVETATLQAAMGDHPNVVRVRVPAMAAM